MADMALDPASGASAEVQDLAGQIKAAQDPEIQQMTMMLEGWGQPTAMPGATSPDDMEGMDHDMGGMTVSGMMSDEDMAALDRHERRRVRPDVADDDDRAPPGRHRHGRAGRVA